MSKYLKIIGKEAKKAIKSKVDSKTKNKVLNSFLLLLTKNQNKILQENKKDIKFAKKNKQTQNVEVCRRLLGHSDVSATSAYLGIQDSDALEVAKNINI